MLTKTDCKAIAKRRKGEYGFSLQANSQDKHCIYGRPKVVVVDLEPFALACTPTLVKGMLALTLTDPATVLVTVLEVATRPLVEPLLAEADEAKVSMFVVSS